MRIWNTADGISQLLDEVRLLSKNDAPSTFDVAGKNNFGSNFLFGY